jgi:hypothetical protein
MVPFPTAPAAAGPLRVRLVGLGAVGAAIAANLAADPGWEIVEAVDNSAALRGRPLAEIAPGYAGGIVVRDAVDGGTPADVAVVCTSSRMAEIVPAIESLIDAGCHVLTIAEELGFPAFTDPAAAERLDKLAADRGVSVLGTGCNPGMIMDTLPAVLSGLLLNVQRVEITRSADMSRYGGILGKFGLGLTPAAFDAGVASGRVAGHIGFAQSISALASALDWRLDRVEVDPVAWAQVTPVIWSGEHVRIDPGTVSAVRHCARGTIAGRAVIDVRAYFGIFTPEDDLPRGDTLTLTSAGQTITVAVPGGYESFRSTVAMAVNCTRALPRLAPGLRTMADLTVGQLAARGSTDPG